MRRPARTSAAPATVTPLAITLDSRPAQSTWQEGLHGPAIVAGVQSGQSAPGAVDNLVGSSPEACFGSGQRLDRCDGHETLHGIGDLSIERDQSVGLELC
jgi:hypothetical protein